MIRAQIHYVINNHIKILICDTDKNAQKFHLVKFSE